jgi:hypothetical protein
MSSEVTEFEPPLWKCLAIRHPAVFYGLVCVPIGVAIGLFVSRDAGGDGFGLFPVSAALSAFLTSAFFWWLIIQRKNQPSRKRAVVVGILSGLFSHWLCWYFMILWANLDFWLFGGTGSSLGEAPIDPLSGVVGALAYSLWSWLFFAWLTVSVAVILALFNLRLRPISP